MIDFNKWFGRRRLAASASAHPAVGVPPSAEAVPPSKLPMSNSRLLLVIALQAALIIGLTWALVYFARDEYNAIVEREEEEIETASRVGAQDGAAMVKLSAQERQANGIETRPLQGQSSSARAQLYATVLDLAPLFDARAKYLAALDEGRVVRAQLTRSEAEYRRAAALFKDDRSVSQRVLQEAQALWRADQAKLAASNRAAAEIAASMRQRWGESLAARATQASSELLTKLARGEDVLVQAVSASQEPPAQLDIAPLGNEQDWVSARLIGPAPRGDAQFAGPTFFYHAPGRTLRLGMQLVARHEAGQRVQGVVVPREAVVWHGGKSWVYLQHGGEAFVRREVAASEPLEQGWFVREGFSAGQVVVVSGAQLLLSEEFRYQIRNENDD